MGGIIKMARVNNPYKLKFHDDFYNPILEGVKVATSRSEPKPIDKGDVIEVFFKPSNRKCKLKILKHYAIRFKDIDEDNAKSEGYLHEDLLKHELKNIYPDLKPNHYIYIYQFQREIYEF